MVLSSMKKPHTFLQNTCEAPHPLEVALSFSNVPVVITNESHLSHRLYRRENGRRENGRRESDGLSCRFEFCIQIWNILRTSSRRYKKLILALIHFWTIAFCLRLAKPRKHPGFFLAFLRAARRSRKKKRNLINFSMKSRWEIQDFFWFENLGHPPPGCAHFGWGVRGVLGVCSTYPLITTR